MFAFISSSLIRSQVATPLSAAADGPARRAASRASCCTQRRTLGVIIWLRSSVEGYVDRCRYCQWCCAEYCIRILFGPNRRPNSVFSFGQIIMQKVDRIRITRVGLNCSCSTFLSCSCDQRSKLSWW